MRLTLDPGTSVPATPEHNIPLPMLLDLHLRDTYKDNRRSQVGQELTENLKKPRPLGSSYYRYRVTLDASQLHDSPGWFELTPGMPLTADVKVGQHILVRYLLSRVLPTLTDGMREP